MLVSATLCRSEPDQWLPLMLKAIDQWVDKMILVVDSLDKLSSQNLNAINCYHPKAVIIQHPYGGDRGADGRQRNAYLNHLKKHHLNDWCIVVDSDEVISDHDGIKLEDELRKVEAGGSNALHVKMHHYAWNLGWEDSTYDPHLTPWRVFKITEALYYDEVEHPVLKGWTGEGGALLNPALHHYGITSGLGSEIAKYRRQVERSNMHSPEQLKQWWDWHIAGRLPVKRVPWEQHPMIVREHYGS